ncbi:unnamed protein product [marine sediment metagenome]|uniref:Uncharacterized protein n=1 Tax=marine sediment metagenome TaxID=412755 RepID=X1DAY8_9ZZZZ
MIMQDQATFPSKIKNYNESSLIHNLFVFNKSGVCFYGRNFTDYIKVENILRLFLGEYNDLESYKSTHPMQKYVDKVSIFFC